MNGDSGKHENPSETGERSLVDSAWAQFEALAKQRNAPSADALRSLSLPGYRILREIHRGGQGVVYQGVHESTHRKVAIKILKESAFADPTELARFDREVDILSRLKHRHIVAIHDRGRTAGRAYYIMDYIPGRPLDAYVAGEDLSPRKVWGLCHKICEAVSVAHLRGVIHRDLKPSNIRVDEEGEPHVLDFGLAKLSQDSITTADPMTLTGQFVGTLPWASPEQADGRSDLLDIRTDVYSLGVIFYQLLTGSFPYAVSGRMSDVVRNIVYATPVRPSALVRNFDRDGEVILLKCLAKDPERRYQSAGDLARDIQRYLNREAIEARPATSFYQLRQFARRNKALVTSVVAIIIILAGASAGTTWAMLRSREATAQATAINEFMREVLTSVSPHNQGADVRLIEVLASATAMAPRRFGAHPMQEAQVHDLLARIFRELSMWPEAKSEYEKALRLLQEHVGADDPRTLVAEAAYTNAAFDGGMYEAEPLFEKLMPRLDRVLGHDHRVTLAARVNVAFLLAKRGRIEEAQTKLRELRAHPLLLQEDGLQIQILRALISAIARQPSDDRSSQVRAAWIEAEPLAREWRDRALRKHGADSIEMLRPVMTLAEIHIAKGDFRTAADSCRSILAEYTDRLGECHFRLLGTMSLLADALAGMGESQEAAELCLRTLSCHRKKSAPEDPTYLVESDRALAFLNLAERGAEGESLARELAASLSKLAPGHGDMIFGAELYVARFVSLQGRLEEAEQMFQTLLAREAYANGFDRARFHLFYGSQLVRRRLFPEAEKELLEAVEIVGDIRKGTGELRSDDVIQGFIALYEAWGKSQKAEEYRRLCAEILPTPSEGELNRAPQ